MNSVVVLQARTSSTRLPGKVLLPINDIPIVILSARRAGNTGRNVIVATSDDPSDDYLEKLVSTHDIKCSRGSLDNVLDRFITALADFDDDTLVFRLTADNVVPDGILLDSMEAEFHHKALSYLVCNGEGSGVPYGLSAELMWLKDLREAAKCVETLYDKEHVTPYIRRKHGVTYFDRYTHLRSGHYRCTVDNFDDYLAMQKVFAGIEDPETVAFHDLIERIKSSGFQPCSDTSVKKLVLGTVQLGLDYGIANVQGKPTADVAAVLIKSAIVNGAEYLDTARAYGDSEQIIGKVLQKGWLGRVKVATKLSPLNDCPAGATPECINAFVDKSILQSMVALQVPKIDVLMLHRPSHLYDWNGNVWKRVKELKENQWIETLGVSVQTPEELSEVLEFKEIEHIQLPYNILDWRWDKIADTVSRIRNTRKLTIHVRSTLLQGLLVSENDAHWIRANVSNARDIQDWLSEQTRVCNRNTTVDLCLAYVNAQTWIDGIVLGMENVFQLEKNVGHLGKPPLTDCQISQIRSSRPILSEKTLNPVFWKKI